MVSGSIAVVAVFDMMAPIGKEEASRERDMSE